jgi:hypothetical protein
MEIRHKARVKLTLRLLCILALTLLLVACGNIGETTPLTAPTPTPTPPGTPYTGDGYTLTYPHNWQASTQDGVVTLRPSSGNVAHAIAITVVPGGGDVDAALNGGLESLKGDKGYKQDSTLPSTAKVGGQTWKQAGGSGETEGIRLKSVLMATPYPSSTGNLYIISLAASENAYDKVYQDVYKPILDSFKFTS